MPWTAEVASYPGTKVMRHGVSAWVIRDPAGFIRLRLSGLHSDKPQEALAQHIVLLLNTTSGPDGILV